MKSEAGELIGRRIEERLEALDMTQTELANRIHISQQTISQYVRGESVPLVDKLMEMAKVFGCSTDELLGINHHTERKNAALGRVIAYCRELMKE